MVKVGNEFKSICSQDGSCSVDVGEYAGAYKVRFKVGDVERGTIDDNGLFTIDSISCRGLLKTTAFETESISVVGGSIIVRPGDVLASDMTASDTSTLTIMGNETFIVGDILRIKESLNDEWFQVTGIGSAPTYNVTRDRGSSYSSGNNPAWKKGASVVNYGTSGKGGVLLTSSMSNAPYVSIFTHAGSPWATIIEEGRFGNLNGYLGYSSDIHGFGVGSSATGEANLTFDTTNGIRLRQGTTDIITLDMSGNAKISEFYIDSAEGLYSGAGATRVQMKPGAGIWLGATAFGDAPFRVDEAGELWATNAHISGSIEAGELHIPDKDITANSFHTNITGDSWWGCTETAFNSNHDNATAYILRTGICKFQNATLTDGDVSGFTADEVEGLYFGTGATRVQMKPGGGFWCGATAFGDAPFSVSNAGALTAASGTIGGWTIESNKISIYGLELDQCNNRIRAFTGSNYVDITAGGITGYDMILGTTFKLLTDGSAPEFSSGIIKECVYEIYTAGVIKTDADPITNGGLLINNTELRGYTSAGLKILQLIYDGSDQGDAYFGDYDNSNAGIKYDHSAGTLSIRGSVTFVSATGYANISDKPTDLADINSAEGIKLTGIATGADVTSANTASNTSNVGTLPVSTVQGWAHATDTTKIDGGDIYTNTVTATQIYVTSLSALNANMGTITAGNITLNTSGFLRTSGKDNYADTTAGIFLGYDSTTYKLNIGDAANYFKWTGSSVEIASSGSIDILAGGDISMYAATGNPSKINFYDLNDDYICSFEATSFNTFSILSKTTNAAMLIGTTSDKFYEIELVAESVKLLGYKSSAWYAHVKCHSTLAISYIELYSVHSSAVSSIRFSNKILYPSISAFCSLGNSTYYWDDISYKTLTDRGCLGWFDEGVEMQDGTIVSDIEALKSIKKHPTKLTIYGVPMMDYKSMPKSVYKQADDHGELLPRDEDDEPYNTDNECNKVIAADGAETTALISIMIGAIKELDLKVTKLREETK